MRAGRQAGREGRSEQQLHAACLPACVAHAAEALCLAPCSPDSLASPPAGIYSVSYPGYPSDLYKSNRYRDKLMLAAAWLYRATGEGARGEHGGRAYTACFRSCLR